MGPPIVTTLQQIGLSALYAPPGSETWVFLRWNTTSLPATIPFDDTWAASGSPKELGDYAFLLSVPTTSTAPKVEELLRSVFSAPNGATGFGWVGSSAVGATAVPTKLVSNLPVVANDTSVALPPGIMPMGFMAGMSLISTNSGLLATLPYPKPPVAPVGIEILLFGGLAGCMHFTGALKSTVQGDTTDKQLADVLVDPLRLTNSKRTRIKPLAVEYALSGTPTSGYTFLPVP